MGGTLLTVVVGVVVWAVFAFWAHAWLFGVARWGADAQSPSTAMASISTLKPPGKALTGTMARAGLCAPKNSA